MPRVYRGRRTAGGAVGQRDGAARAAPMARRCLVWWHGDVRRGRAGDRGRLHNGTRRGSVVGIFRGRRQVDARAPTRRGAAEQHAQSAAVGFLEPALVGERSDDWSAVERRRAGGGARSVPGGRPRKLPTAGTGRRGGSSRPSRFPMWRCSSSTPWACPTPRGRTVHSTSGMVDVDLGVAAERGKAPGSRRRKCTRSTAGGTRCGCRTIRDFIERFDPRAEVDVEYLP